MVAGKEVAIVTSGAVAHGLPALGLDRKPADPALKQAAAACGQAIVMGEWRDAFARCNRGVGQFLIGQVHLQTRQNYTDLRGSLDTLLAHGIVPIVNENDACGGGSMKIGNNDLLAAELSGILFAQLVVLLTTTNGIFTADPLRDTAATRISEVPALTEEVASVAGGAADLGTGGLQTKIEAARIARRHGVATVIASGFDHDVLTKVINGDDIGTLIHGPDSVLPHARKRWIASTLRPRGVVLVDQGAFTALEGGASLLFPGIVEIHGDFAAGDAIDIACGSTAGLFARGIATVSSAEARMLRGREPVSGASERLGRLPDELVHRDNLVLLKRLDA